MKRLASYISAACALLLSLAACNKTSNSTYLPVNDTVAVKPAVIVIDTVAYKLISTSDEQAGGKFVYRYEQTPEAIRHNGDFTPGVIVVGTTGNGYLRKVVSVTADASTMTLTTAPAKLEDVFQQGEINFSSNWINASGLETEFFTGNKTIVNNGTATVMLNSATFTSNYDRFYSLKYQAGKLYTFNGYTNNGTGTANIDLSINANGSTTLNAKDSVWLQHISNTMLVNKIPLKFIKDRYLCYEINGSTASANELRIRHSSQDSFMYTSAWLANYWTRNQNARSTTLADNSVTTIGVCNLIVKAGLKDVISLYGMPVAVVYTPSTFTIAGRNNGNDRDLAVTHSFTPEISEKAYVYGYAPLEFVQSISNVSKEYTTPAIINKIAGDNQTGTPGRYLANPIVVQVMDNTGKPQKGVSVYFNVVAGGGNLSVSTITTDDAGIAKTNWQVGNGTPQRVQASIKKGDGTLATTPVTFSAN